MDSGHRSQLPWSTNEAADDAKQRAAEHERRVMISYPFPVGGAEMIANLRLPKYLSRGDAERLKAAIDTLVTDSRAE